MALLSKSHCEGTAEAGDITTGARASWKGRGLVKMTVNLGMVTGHHRESVGQTEGQVRLAWRGGLMEKG